MTLHEVPTALDTPDELWPGLDEARRVYGRSRVLLGYLARKRAARYPRLATPLIRWRQAPSLAVLDVAPAGSVNLADADSLAGMAARWQRVLVPVRHPLQILIRTRPLDAVALAEPFRAHPLGESFADWLEQWACGLLARQVLLVVPGPDEGQRSERLMRGLASLGLVGRLLSANERRAIFEDMLGPSPVLGRPERDYASIGEVAYRTLAVTSWPRRVRVGWLAPLLERDVACDLALHIAQEPTPPALKRLGRQLAKHRVAASERVRDPLRDLAMRDLETLRDRLADGTEQVWRVGLYATVPTARTPLVESALEDTLATATPTDWRHDLGRQATLPIGVDPLAVSTRVDTSSVAATWPFADGGLRMPGGVPLGRAVDAPALVQPDLFAPELENWSLFVAGMMGSGKSYLLKLLAWRYALRGVPVVFVDQKPDREYAAVVRALGGHYAGPQVADFAGPAVGIDLAGVPAMQRATVLRELTDRLWRWARADLRPRLLVIDEAWVLTRTPAGAAFLESFGRLARSAYLGVVVATQQPDDLLDSEEGRALIRNAGSRLLLRQDDSALGPLAKQLALGSAATSFLRGALIGQGLLSTGGRLVALEVAASPAEHALITTSPQERAREGVFHHDEPPGDIAADRVSRPRRVAAGARRRHRAVRPGRIIRPAR